MFFTRCHVDNRLASSSYPADGECEGAGEYGRGVFGKLPIKVVAPAIHCSTRVVGTTMPKARFDACNIGKCNGARATATLHDTWRHHTAGQHRPTGLAIRVCSPARDGLGGGHGTGVIVEGTDAGHTG